MSRWLSQLAERSHQAHTLSGALQARQPVYIVLDQRRSPEQCRALLSYSGKQDFITLFAGTSLSPLLAASPWLLAITMGSPAWDYAATLCQQRLGWVCQPTTRHTLYSVANHLQALLVLDDSHGGKTLITLQQPAVWAALLASAPASTCAQWLSPLQRVAIPTPQGQWLIWQADKSTSSPPTHWSLSGEMEAAVNESQQAWWLSQMNNVPLAALPVQWLVRMHTLVQAGISRSDHLKRLLPLITDQREARWDPLASILNDTSLSSRQKVRQLEQWV